MSLQPELPFIDPGQLVLRGLGPSVGERYRNRNTGTICTVESVDQRRIGWVTVRILGGRQTLTVASLLSHFARI